MELITGIQQAGIGVADAAEAKEYYKNTFGMNVLIFEDIAPAVLMSRYTGNQIHRRHALLTMNMAGGGGFEIWQYTSRSPENPMHSIRLGDLGLFAIKIKAADVLKAHRHFKQLPGVVISSVMTAPDDRPHFWIKDQYNNQFNVVEGDDWFSRKNAVSGGVVGAVIGVADMEKAIAFYSEVLGINKMIYCGEAPMMDVPDAAEQGKCFKRALLKKPLSLQGAFSNLLGSIQIELVQRVEDAPQKIYANRYWGDCGFIHLCFDVSNMQLLKEKCAAAGFCFSIDSADSFSMGDSAGRFCYVEDPDGTLIELVETHKVPILKKWGWYLNLQTRKHQGPLPDWMIGLLSLNKIR